MRYYNQESINRFKENGYKIFLFKKFGFVRKYSKKARKFSIYVPFIKK